MTIEQHAEAAAEEIDRSMTDGPKAIIAKHMQSAIDEATAKQMAWIAVLNGEIARLEEDVKRANTERIRTQESSEKTDNEVCQTLGKELHYPWFKDDQKNFPGATEADGVCVGDHVAETLAAEAAKRIAALEGLGPLIEEYLTEVNRMFYLEDQSDEMLDLSLKINAILKGGAS